MDRGFEQNSSLSLLSLLLAIILKIIYDLMCGHFWTSCASTCTFCSNLTAFLPQLYIAFMGIENLPDNSFLSLQSLL